jgi:phage tail sheath protein FI
MAERVFKSAGVVAREIDLSAPSQNTPSGVPAGVIGTAEEGPAFVPVTVSNFRSFQSTFGSIDGSKFGPIAVNEWLRNAQSATYVRVLGIGDGKRKNTTSGKVTNAGFVVGARQVDANGNLATDNPYANSGVGSIEGRSYFLGCFMSESAGSTVFSSAGVQKTTVASGAKATKTLTVVSRHMDNTDDLVIKDGHGNQLTITIGIAEAWSVKSGEFTSLDLTAGGTAGEATFTIAYNVAGVGSVTDYAKGFINIIRAAASYSDAEGRGFKLTADAYAASATNIVLRADGQAGNNATVTATNTAGSPGIADDLGLTTGVETDGFAGGINGNHAVPILRGVLLAPSGVVLHLSGNSRSANVPVKTETARLLDGSAMGRHGAITGSVNLSTEVFSLLLNGHKSTTTYPNIITASFDLLNEQQYFRNVFNTDPTKIEQAGHLLYSSYDIHPNLANVTGSGVISAGNYSKGDSESALEDVGFLLTSSLGRGAASAVVPDYEGFETRFTYAESPFVMTQKYGSDNKNLFKVIALSAGKKPNQRFKITIDNLTRANSTTYPSFDLLVRDFFDSDEDPVVLEAFRNINLDPTSNRFIGRVIGDLNVYFDFDKSTLSQKINVKGDHPVLSNYIRIEMSDNLKAGNIPVDAMPMGFRGPLCLNTSGSIMCQEEDSVFTLSDYHRRVVQPPIPYRKSIAVGTGEKKRVNTSLNWGVQFNNQTDINEPNKPSLFNESFISIVKFFPKHRLDVSNFNVASDTFNNNKFCLENIQIRTGSGGTAGGNLKADPEYWLSASYVRTGNISSNATNKTRALEPRDFEVPGNRRYSGFNLFLQGGFDGVNIFDNDKSNLTNNAARREMNDSDQGERNGPTVAAYRKAVDIMGSKADVDIKLLAIPGIREPGVTDYAISAVESRFDALYIMDIEETNNAGVVLTGSGVASVKKTVDNFKNRGLDSSFAAAYFPDVTKTVLTTTIGRSNSVEENLITVPPSVVALGAFSYNDAVAHPWFAPAGFTRGALEAVESAAIRFNRNNLDDVYDADINPLTAFPGTGVVIWGQKTLLQNSSALDRVNVRRLLINIRRSVRNVANTLLFEPNRQETLDRFNSLVNPILQRVQEQGGVDRYKVIIDTTTTTQADVENNTIRGKIFLQPTRAVEFVALDFVVTNAGSEGL